MTNDEWTPAGGARNAFGLISRLVPSGRAKGGGSMRFTRSGLFALACLVAALTSPAVARGDAVTDWNRFASTAIVTNAGQPPPVSALSFAMVQGAVYDAVNAIDQGHQPYLSEPPSNPTDSKEAAAATA